MVSKWHGAALTPNAAGLAEQMAASAKSGRTCNMQACAVSPL